MTVYSAGVDQGGHLHTEASPPPAGEEPSPMARLLSPPPDSGAQDSRALRFGPSPQAGLG